MSGWLFDNGSLAALEEAIVDQIHNMNDIKLTPLQHVTKDSLRFRSLSVAGLVISTLKFSCFHLILLCFSFLRCIGIFRCVLKKIIVCQKISLCSGKDCCVSKEKLCCALSLWATT